jgi:hypothetical protein
MLLKVANFWIILYDHDIINLVSKKSSRRRKYTEIILCLCNEVYDY